MILLLSASGKIVSWRDYGEIIVKTKILINFFEVHRPNYTNSLTHITHKASLKEMCHCDSNIKHVLSTLHAHAVLSNSVFI